MSEQVLVDFRETDFDGLCQVSGRVAVLIAADDRPGAIVRRLDRKMRGAISRALANGAWAKLKVAEALDLKFPAGVPAEAVQLVKLPRKSTGIEARKAGSAIGRELGEAGVAVLAANHPRAADVAFGLTLGSYAFSQYHTDDKTKKGNATFHVDKPDAVRAAAAPMQAVAQGVCFTRDLVNEPANVLTTVGFSDRLAAMRDLGLEIEILDEEQLEKLGMRALLGVGQGSDSPSKVVVMQWKGADTPPLALIGKGVVFDSGGLSIKPAGGMEEMITDMGGAGVVAGTMMALAARKAAAHVVGLVGLVENMPDGRAQRPGDVVRSMKGDTIEIINTDAEGRLVLADVLWYAQERFQPTAMIDLATLTGACVVALGHENAAVFANDDALAGAVLKAAEGQGEGAWRMPLGPAYDQLIKSRMADMKNTGGRWGGAITAAQFLQRFVKPGTPWVHLDIAGVTLPPGETTLAPKGATGWGVRTLDALVRARFETGTSA